MVAVTALVVPSITDTVPGELQEESFPQELAAYTVSVAWSTATA